MDLHVGLAADGDDAVLTVSDDGPGLQPDAASGDVRRPGAPASGSTSRVRTAQGCGGSLTLGTGTSGGSLVTVRLPLTAP